MAVQPETRLKEQCIKLMQKMRERGKPICWRKVHGSGYSVKGEPDLDICYHGRAVKVELKLPGKHPTKIQRHRLAEWEKAGAVTGVVHSATQLSWLLTDVIAEVKADGRAADLDCAE